MLRRGRLERERRRKDAIERLKFRMEQPDEVLKATAKRFRGAEEITPEALNKYKAYMKKTLKDLEEIR